MPTPDRRPYRPLPYRPLPRHPRAAVAVLTLATAVGSAAAAACSRDARAAAPATNAPAAPATPVRVQSAERDTSRAVIRAGGVTEPRATADLAFQVPGRVVAVAVDEGTRVARGQLLAALDPTDYRLAYEQAELARARQADELARARVLRASGSIAANDFDKLDNGARQAAVAGALAAKRLADARLTAPFAGTIARKAVEVGATAGTGSTVLTLVDLSEVEVRVGVSEADVGQVRVGRPASVEVPALGRTFDGRVAHVGVVADPASRTYAVKVALPNAAGALRGGMVATILLPTGRARDAVVVPAAAVARDPDGATEVFVYDPRARRVRARRVEVGDARGADVEVTRGLAVGEPVVVAGQQRLRDGSAVVVAGER
ncbi:MexH family multidrug efflux RND transporter periplasmic adaptor subunit [Gemmatimonadetes bacterium T265]|nr:MexH family multidrug efflux RND transporter periplasmic adaptor subunit [Gemmatimonadetes bacterium T265]